MALLNSYSFNCSIYKIRNFDTIVKTIPAMSKLYDCAYECMIPKTQLYDNITYIIRQSEALSDPFTSTKDDAGSFFSVNEMKDDNIESTYISPNLKVITPFSDALNRPLGRFDLTKSISSMNISSSGTDSYVALNFEDVEDFNNFEIVRKGIFTIVAGALPLVNTPFTHIDVKDVVDVSNIKAYGIVDKFSLPQNFETSSYVSMYCCVLYIPNSATTYYFSFTASSVGFLLINGVTFLYQSAANSTTPVTGEIQLQQGYHTLIIKQYATADSTNDVVRLQVKRNEPDNYVDFTVTNLDAWGVSVYTFPIYFQDIENEGAEFFNMPSVFSAPSLDSLYMKKYRPIVVLARKYSELLQKEFNRIFYIKLPDLIEYSELITGDITSIYDDYDFPFTGDSVVLNAHLVMVADPFIKYTYLTPVKVSKIEFRDTENYGDTITNGQQCKGFALSVVNSAKTPIRATDLRTLIDLESSNNIQELQLVNDSDIKLLVVKKEIQDCVNIIFKDLIEVREIKISSPVIYSIYWGAIRSFKVYLKAAEIVKLIDNKGEQSIINTTEDTRLIEVDYDYVGYVPAIFNHKNIAPDVQYGAEFIMFSLDVSGEVGGIQTLGNAYICRNYDNHTVYDQTYLLNFRQLSQSDDRKFALYTDIAKTTPYDFKYLYFIPGSDSLSTSFSLPVTVTLTNTSTDAISNKSVLVLLPNLGTEYSCIDDLSAAIPVVGITSSNDMTDDGSVWDTNYVRIAITLAVGESRIYTFNTGTFSDPLTMPANFSGKKFTGEYITHYPVAHSSTYVKATSNYTTNPPPSGTDPSKSLVGAMDSGNGWQANNVSGSQKFNIDYSNPFIPVRMYVENSHVSGIYTDRGVRNIRVYGTNSNTAFSNTTYADTTDLTLLNNVIEVAQHVAADTPDPKYYLLNNTQGFSKIVVRIENSWGGSYVGFRHIAFQEEKYSDFNYSLNAEYSVLQLPVISVKIPQIQYNSKVNVLAFTTDTVASPSVSTGFTIPEQITLAMLLVTEISGTTRNNAEVSVDVSEFKHTFKCPFRVYDAVSRTALDTVGVNNGGIATVNFGEWSGGFIRFRVPVLQGGVGTLFHIKIGNFYGDPATFTPSVLTDLRHLFHFSGNLIDSISSNVGQDNGVLYTADKLRKYQGALQFLSSASSARVDATTATTNFSISFWFVTTSTGGIFCLSDDAALPSTTVDMKVRITSSGYLEVQVISGAGATMIITDKLYNDAQWHHVLLTCHSVNGMKVYIDTIQQASCAITTRTVTTKYAYLGWSGTNCQCSFDELRIYNKCLTADDALSLYTIFDGTLNETEQQLEKTSVVLSPASRLTSLSDLNSLQGTPLMIYKYIDIDETLIRNIGG